MTGALIPALRSAGIGDERVLAAFRALRREDFVPAAYRAMAFVDTEVPLPNGQCMLAPKVEARLLQELGILPHETVYEVGTGSGYLCALLASRARHVTSAEIHPDLHKRAAENLRRAAIDNVTLLEGDSAHAPLADSAVDVIVLTGSVPVLPQAFLDRLSPGGRLFAVVGDAPVMEAMLVRQPERGAFQQVKLFETQLKPLVNAPQPARFRF